jgi:hypothetical protein
MADRDQPLKGGQAGRSDQNPPTGSTGDRPDIGKPGGTVGREVPEHSHAKDTEVAVDAERKGREQPEDKAGKGGERGHDRR